MSAYYTDTILVTSITRTENGEESGVPVTVRCRVEDTNKVIARTDGSNIVANSFIFLSKDTNIKRGDEVQILTIRGVTPPDTARVFQVRKIMNNAGFGVGEFEVWI
jgi:hypothetical protein